MLCVKLIGGGLLLVASPFAAFFGGGSFGIDPGFIGWLAAGVAAVADLLLTGLLVSPKLREWLSRR